MHSNHWLYSWKTLVLASILFPPLGLALVWMRPSTRLSRRILNSIYISALGFFYLYQFAGLRVERDGSGMMPMLSFEKGGDAHYAELERNRARHAQLPLSPPIAQEISSTPPAGVPEPVESVATPRSNLPLPKQKQSRPQSRRVLTGLIFEDRSVTVPMTRWTSSPPGRRKVFLSFGSSP